MPDTNTQFSPIDHSAIRRILVCQLRQIGDVLLATPSIELLGKHYPNAKLDVFTEKKCVPMLLNNPYIHHIWPLDKSAIPTIFSQYAYYKKIASTGYDLVVDFQQLPRCLAVVALSHAKVRITFPPSWYRRHLYTHWCGSEPVYAAAYKAAALKPLGIVWNGEKPRLYLDDAEKNWAKETIKAFGLNGRKIISVDPTHRHTTRRWPARHYARLMDMLAEANPDASFLLAFGPGEQEYVTELQQMCRHADRVILPPTVYSLREMASLIGESALHIGNCSSPRHMAVALDVPTVTVLGSTSTGWSFPSPEHIVLQAKAYMSMPCQNCNQNSCSKNLDCLELLTPEMVFPQVEEHFLTFGK